MPLPIGSTQRRKSMKIGEECIIIVQRDNTINKVSDQDWVRLGGKPEKYIVDAECPPGSVYIVKDV